MENEKKQSVSFVEKTGKTVADARADALNALGVTDLEDVDIEIIDEGKQGIFGIGGRPAKVKATLKTDPARFVKRFIADIAQSIDVAVEVNVTMADEKKMNVEIKGEEMGIFIGKRGQTLDALQYLVNLAVNKGDLPYVSVALDTEDYRARRKETLEKLARNLAKKVKTMRKNVVLEPMSPYERRIIHSVLQGDKFVTTYSEGDEPFRNVVIALKKERDFKGKPDRAQNQPFKKRGDRPFDKKPRDDKQQSADSTHRANAPRKQFDNKKPAISGAARTDGKPADGKPFTRKTYGKDRKDYGAVKRYERTYGDILSSRTTPAPVKDEQ